MTYFCQEIRNSVIFLNPSTSFLRFQRHNSSSDFSMKATTFFSLLAYNIQFFMQEQTKFAKSVTLPLSFSLFPTTAIYACMYMCVSSQACVCVCVCKSSLPQFHVFLQFCSVYLSLHATSLKSRRILKGDQLF